MDDPGTMAAVVFLRSLIGLLMVFVPLLAVELAWNRQPTPLASRMRGLAFNIAYIAVRTGYFLAIYLLFHNAGLKPLFDLPAWAGVPVALLAYDFCYYWMHRALHAVPILWRIHAVHHSSEHLGAGSGYHHVGQIVVEDLFLAIPMALLAPPEAATLVGFWIGIHGAYLHSTTRLNLGPLAVLINDNRTHRIHHSRDPAHYNRNFGVPSMIWDHLFGTAHVPTKDEWPDVGLDEMCEPRNLREFLWPWGKPVRRARAAAALAD